MSLVQYLRTGELGGVSKGSLVARLAHPWGFPASPELQALADRVIEPPGERISAGEALLVSVDASGLWRLTAARLHDDDIELRGSAAESARLARRLVMRDLPLYGKVDSLHRVPTWFASPFAIFAPAPGCGPTTALDGESYGLSIALATASFELALPTVNGLVASAALRSDGSLVAVDAIGRKVQLVLEEAPGVTRMLVATGQEAEAIEARDEALQKLGIPATESWLDIVPVGTFQEAFAIAFPGALDALKIRWREPANAARLAKELYRTAIYGTPMVLGWSAVATCASALSTMVEDPEMRAKLEAVRLIAARHAGAGELMAWPDEAELAAVPRSLRLRLLAHVVQSAADAGTKAITHATRALSLVHPKLERAPEDAVLLGAVGRAMAAGGADAEAMNALRDAVDAWSEVGSPHESSYPLCELLRLLGIAGRREEVLALCAHEVTDYARDPRSSEKSVGYVRVAAGRALVQIGGAENALEYLDDDGRWPPLPPEAEGARERWRARALDGVGRREEADECRERLDARRGHGVALAVQAGLAKLDRALRDGENTATVIAVLAELAEPRRTLDRCPPGGDPVQYLAEHTRY
jgi:hypothetical protein